MSRIVSHEYILTCYNRTIGEWTSPNVVVVRVPSLEFNGLAQGILLAYSVNYDIPSEHSMGLTFTAMIRLFPRMLSTSAEAVVRSVDIKRGDLVKHGN